MLKEQIEADFIKAFKERNTVKKNTLGILKSRITEWKANKSNLGKEITDADIITIVASEVKKRNQAIEVYKTAIGSLLALDNIAQEEHELLVLQSYLPTQLSDEDIKHEILEIKSQTPPNLMAAVMQHFNKNFKGQFDNKKLQEILNAEK